MKKFTSNLIDWLGFTLILCNGFYLVASMTAIYFGQFDAIRNSIYGWHGGQVMFVMFGLPLLWALVIMALDSAVNKFNAKA